MRLFHAGQNNEGYWTSSHAKLQLEDATDVLSVVYPRHDFVFKFDQSAGHTKKRKNGLAANKMNVSWGGKAPEMRETEIKELGPHNPILTIGEIQHMVFRECDPGPFYVSDDQKAATKYDVTLTNETIKRKKVKAELLVELRKAGYDTTKKRYLVSELEALCRERNIPLTADEPKVIQGWLGKPKGMLQILYERGHIDTKSIKSYTKTGRKEDYDEEENLTEDGKKYCLTYLMENCEDFKNELTDLEHLAEELSAPKTKYSILFTPKFHCELAGEGIEYSWGAAKRFYRKQSLKDKKTFQQFIELVKTSISRINVQMARRFAGRARGYMLAYMHMKMKEQEQSTPEEDSKKEVRIKIEKSHEYTEKIRKTYVSHRDANVIDGCFIESVIRECIIVE